VVPTEWWDAHWIRDRVARRLAPAVAFEGEAAAPAREARDSDARAAPAARRR
jgi:hypothetical protein